MTTTTTQDPRPATPRRPAACRRARARRRGLLHAVSRKLRAVWQALRSAG